MIMTIIIDEEIYDLATKIVNELPVAVILDSIVLVMHAGIHRADQLSMR